MKVLHLTSGLLFGGGMERVIIDLVKKNKLSSNFLCVINDQWDFKNVEEIEGGKILLCNRKIGNANPFANLNVLYKICLFIKKNRIEIIHCHNSFALKFAYIIKVIMKVKVILTVHDTDAYSRELNKYPIDKYIAISETVYKVVNKYIPKEKISLIYNGVNLDRFFNISRIKNISSKSVNISCVARIMPEKKGQDILIKALDILKNKLGYNNFKCNFAGAIHDEKAAEDLKHLIRKYKLDKNVELLGNVENIEQIYSETDIFVLPSRYEGFGLVVVEALAAGCCVIVSKLDGPLEIIRENEEYGMYFEKEDFKDLAIKLHHLFSNNELINKYKNNSKTNEYLKREFSLENMINKYNLVYQEIL